MSAVSFVAIAIRVKTDRVSSNVLSAEKCFLIDEHAGKIYHFQRALYARAYVYNIYSSSPW